MRLFFLLCLSFLLIHGEISSSFLEERFTDVHDSGVYAYGQETISGLGSSLEHTGRIREKLPKIFQHLKIKSVLDAGCGDFNWMRYVVSDQVQYIGLDIVKVLVEENNKKYGSDTVSFLHADVTQDELPLVDLILCRDLFAHLSFRDAFFALKNFKKSGAKYLLTTTYNGAERANENLLSDKIGYGNYVINLEKPPFNFQKPLFILNEMCPHLFTRDKVLALWRLKDLDVECKGAVTYLDSWGGRLGDNLIMYIKAKWIAYKIGLPFYYKPFRYSDQLMMDELEQRWHEQYINNFMFVENICERRGQYRNLYINIENYIRQSENILYIVHYFFHPHHWGDHPEMYDAQEVAFWKDLLEDPGFRQELRKTIKPKHDADSFTIPKDKVTIAVHVRKGGGFDTPLFSVQSYTDPVTQKERPTENADMSCHCKVNRAHYIDVAYPTKFPPDLFYISQIKKLSERFQDVPMYVHIFTDDRNPEALAKKYEKAVGKSNIIFGYRKQDNHHEKNVLEDLFAMAQFDCLIRSGSNYPQIAQLIGNHKIVVFPKSATWRSMLVIDDVGIITNGDLLQDEG